MSYDLYKLVFTHYKVGDNDKRHKVDSMNDERTLFDNYWDSPSTVVKELFGNLEYEVLDTLDETYLDEI